MAIPTHSSKWSNRCIAAYLREQAAIYDRQLASRLSEGESEALRHMLRKLAGIDQ